MEPGARPPQQGDERDLKRYRERERERFRTMVRLPDCLLVLYRSVSWSCLFGADCMELIDRLPLSRKPGGVRVPVLEHQGQLPITPSPTRK